MHKTLVERFASPHPALCLCCRRRAGGSGIWVDKPGGKIFWLCGQPECVPVANQIKKMKPKQLDAYECTARVRGGDAGGEYLDQIGVTDLAILNTQQWLTFLERVIQGYETSMRTGPGEGQPPF